MCWPLHPVDHLCWHFWPFGQQSASAHLPGQGDPNDKKVKLGMIWEFSHHYVQKSTASWSALKPSVHYNLCSVELTNWSELKICKFKVCTWTIGIWCVKVHIYLCLLIKHPDQPLYWYEKSGSDQQKNRDLGEKIGIMVQ